MGNRLRDADRLNFVVPNTVKRVLHILRESCKILKIDQELQNHCDSQNNINRLEGMMGFEKIPRNQNRGNRAVDDSQISAKQKSDYFQA